MSFALEGIDSEKLITARRHITSYLSSRDELKKLGVIRSNKAIQGDFAEWIVASKMGLTLCKSGVQKGIDATDEAGNTYQIKCRIIKENQRAKCSTSFDFSTIKNHFDYLVGVFLDASTFEVIGIVKVPYETVRQNGNPTTSDFRYRWNPGARADQNTEIIYWEEN